MRITKSVKIIFALLILATATLAQQENKLPIVKSNSPTVSIQDGEKFNKDGWSLNAKLKPDVYESSLVDGKPRKVTFITDVDQISFTVEEGKKYDFIIQRGDELFYQQIVGTRFVPAAVFDQKYQAKHKGKTFVEIPEVYELVNVAIALTPTGIEDKGLVYKNSDYYKNVRQWFDKYQNHPLLAAFDAEIKNDFGKYFSLKMDSYSFEFDRRGKIVQSKVYDRTAWGKTNSLRPFLAQLQSFAEATNFRQFYKQNVKTYDDQIRFYRDAANIAEMKKWLDKNFPASSDYNTFKIIFSPLVAYNQSANWFEDKNFKELHAQVNFPYEQDFQQFIRDNNLSPKSEITMRGNIVFTELNHGYINPEADKHSARIVKAISNRDFWVENSKGSGYYGGIATFNEYMNWGLVNLRYADYAPPEEQDKLMNRVAENMTKRRGFTQFAEFNKFLVNLFRTRQPNQTIADLYPQIIEWFEKNNQTQDKPTAEVSKSASSLQRKAPKPLPTDLIAFFAGEWTGEGKFANGREIKADVKFSAELDNQWLLYSHQDQEPNKYKALGTWGFEFATENFVMVVQDNFGGSRRFQSEGWANGKIVFTNKVSAANLYEERFTFERQTSDNFKMTYEMSRDGKNWRMVDFLVFTRKPLPKL